MACKSKAIAFAVGYLSVEFLTLQYQRATLSKGLLSAEKLRNRPLPQSSGKVASATQHIAFL